MTSATRSFARASTAVVVLLATLLVAAPMAHGLSCAVEPGQAGKSLKRADAAFVGKLESSRGIPDILTLFIRQDEYDDAIYTFLVGTVLKGDLPSRVDVVGSSQYPLGEHPGRSESRAVLLYDRGDGVYGSSPCSEFNPSALADGTTNSKAPHKGHLSVSRMDLFDPVRVGIGAGAALASALLIAAGIRVFIRRRRTRRS